MHYTISGKNKGWSCCDENLNIQKSKNSGVQIKLQVWLSPLRHVVVAFSELWHILLNLSPCFCKVVCQGCNVNSNLRLAWFFIFFSPVVCAVVAFVHWNLVLLIKIEWCRAQVIVHKLCDLMTKDSSLFEHDLIVKQHTATSTFDIYIIIYIYYIITKLLW